MTLLIPRLHIRFRNKLIFYGDTLLTPRPTLKLEDHSLSAVRDCLFIIFAATLHTWRASPPSATWGRAMPWWQGTHLTSATWERAMPWWQGTHLTWWFRVLYLYMILKKTMKVFAYNGPFHCLYLNYILQIRRRMPFLYESCRFDTTPACVSELAMCDCGNLLFRWLSLF
jgi:hypothetical protein